MPKQMLVAVFKGFRHLLYDCPGWSGFCFSEKKHTYSDPLNMEMLGHGISVLSCAQGH